MLGLCDFEVVGSRWLTGCLSHFKSCWRLRRIGILRLKVVGSVGGNSAEGQRRVEEIVRGREVRRRQLLSQWLLLLVAAKSGRCWN